MSRIGRQPVPVGQGVNVRIDGKVVTVKGPKGQLRREFSSEVTIEQRDGTLVVARQDDEPRHRALHGLSRSLLANMVEGVSNGFTRVLEVQGVGYRVAASANGTYHVARLFPRRRSFRSPRNNLFRGRNKPGPHRGNRQRTGGPGGGEHSRHPQTGALQGQRHSLPGRECAPQGWKGGQGRQGRQVITLIGGR